MRGTTFSLLCVIIGALFGVQGCGSEPSLTQIYVVPSSDTAIIQAQQTVQFKAYGIYTRKDGISNSDSIDITTKVQWQAFPSNVATINSSGTLTGVSSGIAKVTATIGSQVGNSNVAVNPGSSVPSILLAGVGNGAGTVTSSPGPINCTIAAGGVGSGVCNAFFSSPTSVTLTATPASGSSFGGWSNNCQPANQPTCTIDVAQTDNVTVIFN